MKVQGYKGKYSVRNTQKYDGDPTQVIYRSLWERQVFRWLDDHPGVVSWSSESVVIPYICKSDGRGHRYFVDLKIKFSNGRTYLVEIKPATQCKEPKPKKRITPRFIAESMTYLKNTSKWEAAKEYCEDRGFIFEVWTEHTLKALGIKILG
jgi:hypothetical protein